MTKSEKAVAVARDVLVQLRRRRNPIVPTMGNYVETPCEIPRDATGDLADFLPAIQGSGCEVCALGALLLSKARIHDHVPIEDIVSTHYTGKFKVVSVGQDDAIRLLVDVFGKRTMYQIESAFEVAIHRTPAKYRDRRLYGAVVFGSRFEDSKVRLRAIMQNVVDNGGKLVVPLASYGEADVAFDTFHRSFGEEVW